MSPDDVVHLIVAIDINNQTDPPSQDEEISS